MIKLSKASVKDRNYLWQVLQEYLHELSKYYPLETDQQGNYIYKYFDAYFTEKERKALFILNDQTPIGFALINPYSLLDHEVDYVMAEFSIFPPYRHKSLGAESASCILTRFKGRWEIKYSEKNIPAKKLWEKATAQYIPAKYSCGENETILAFSNK